jgi:hypothetical protein
MGFYTSSKTLVMYRAMEGEVMILSGQNRYPNCKNILLVVHCASLYATRG